MSETQNTQVQKTEVFIIAALTTDGFITKHSAEAAMWTSKEDKARFVALTKDARVMIMGANTFRTFPKPLKDRHHVIYSRSEKFEDKWPDGNVETTTLSPAELIQNLTTRGYTKIAICGGQNIYSQFIKSGVVTKLYLTIEPILFGAGITMFNESLSEDTQLTLIKTEQTENGTMFLDYVVNN